MPSRRHARRSIALFLAMSLAALSLLAAPAKPKAKPSTKAPAKDVNYFRLDKVKSTFSHACGFRVAAGDKPGATERTVILSSVDLDCAALDQDFDPVATAESAVEEKKGAYATLHIGAEGNRIDGSWRSTEPSDGFSFGGQGEVQLTRNDDARVEGRYYTPKPESFFDKSFEFDLRFAVDLLAGSVSGTSLPKGGGELGKVYQAYLKAVAKEDPQALRKVVVKERADEIASQVEADVFKVTFHSSRSLELKTCTITGGLMKTDRAALDVEGKTFDGDKMRGQVYLVKEDGAWKVGGRKLKMAFD